MEQFYPPKFFLLKPICLVVRAAILGETLYYHIPPICCMCGQNYYSVLQNSILELDNTVTAYRHTL